MFFFCLFFILLLHPVFYGSSHALSWSHGCCSLLFSAAFCSRCPDGTDNAYPHVERQGMSKRGHWGGRCNGGRSALPLHSQLPFPDRPAGLRDPRHWAKPLQNFVSHRRRQPKQHSHLSAAHPGPCVRWRCEWRSVGCLIPAGPLACSANRNNLTLLSVNTVATFQPAFVFQDGHNDWIFSIAWISDNMAVSGK